MVWQRCEGALVHDAMTGHWRSVGHATPAPSLARVPTGVSRSPRPIDTALMTIAPDAYTAAVERAIELIRAGDIYQVNLAHTIDAALRTHPRALSAALMEAARPWYGAHVEHADPDGRLRAVCSASPELFLELDPIRGRGNTRRITTRPMKGTLPGHLEPAALVRSSKERAELDMITDLMRNDLARVCAPASVRVGERQAIEPHGQAADHAPAVWQGVATITGLLRPRTTLLDLLRAVFPPGSVTGAPKIRAMQIIEALEGQPRGPYCGCIGFIGDDGRVALSVAIRTALAETPPHDAAMPHHTASSPQGLVSYSVGAGIVADSVPAREWDETLHKAAALLRLGASSTDPTIVALTSASPQRPRPTPET